ncbi:kinase-like domain-containing protein [Corynascus novoguineensis]|uniref:Kinase-like domain-containing protein n=1 Tax=Corynascus novoguineensis TaxID=1126955 RepID=A0AAN7CMF7_9PEZI|nr:kinase-like domain-containing protein [Corynascus novoguineensis]
MTLAQRGEGSILPTLDHPHIIRAFGSDGWGTSQVEIVLNLMDGNLASLADRLARPRALLAKQVLRQMLRALAHLSALGYVHRDIKPENIFFVRVGGPNDGDDKGDDYDNGCSPLAYPFHFRLGDFGLCEHRSRIGANEVHGTTSFLAPELLLVADIFWKG